MPPVFVTEIKPASDMGRISFLVCQSLAFLYGSMQKERVGNMKKSKTGKWSILLAAFVLTTGLSGVIQAADYTQGLTGVVGEDQPLLMGAGNTCQL